MKIVQVIHGFPPYNMAGSELYTYNLSRYLAKKDEVYVFHRIADPKLEEYKMSFGTYGGLNVRTINNTFKYCDSFEKTYRNDIISKKFGSFLNEVNPDIVHFGHITGLSTTLIKVAKEKKISVVFTLHDFWLFCQLGQLLKQDLSLCYGPKDSECARCLAPQLSINGGVKKAFEVIRRTIPNFENRTFLGEILGGVHRHYAKVFFLFQKDAQKQIKERSNHIKEMLSLVDLFISPSNFLLKKFVEFGIPREKIVYNDNGFDTSLFNDFSKVKSEKIRFGYIGTLIPSKGVHILLDAFKHFKSQNVELRIHGKFLPYHPGFEDYPNHLRSLGKQDNILWGGEYDNKDIASVLSEIDILVVPSIWHENSPLTIHEAFMARIPVITSNIGGMAELVQDRVNGFLFQVGDSKDLAKKMQMLIDTPDLIERLGKNVKSVIPIENHASEIREIYRGLVSKGKDKVWV